MEVKTMQNKNTNKKLSMLIALFMVLMAASVGVSADGTDPLDGSDGGADWDGDGLTNAEEQQQTQGQIRNRQTNPRRTPKGKNQAAPRKEGEN